MPRDLAPARERQARVRGQVYKGPVVTRSGDSVARGRTVLSVVSDEMFSAQERLKELLAVRDRDSEVAFGEALLFSGLDEDTVRDIVSSNVQALIEARDHLVGLGFPGRQIKKLARTGKSNRVVPILSPCDAIIDDALPPGTEFRVGERLFCFSKIESFYVSAHLQDEVAQTLDTGGRAQMWATKRPEQVYAAMISGIGMMGLGAGALPIHPDHPTPVFLTIAHDQPELSLSDEVCVQFGI